MSQTALELQVNMVGHVKTITFNRPQKKNALSHEMAYALRDAILESVEDDSRVIVLTGAGDDFCAGADLNPTLLGSKDFNVTSFLQETYNPAIKAMRSSNKPFIAGVKGNCVGIGLSFALACDLVYASEDARFSSIFTKIGISSDGGAAFFLAEQVGYQKAFELMATHAMIPAEEALSMRLVNKILPKDELSKKVDELAHSLASGPFIAIQHTKANLRAAVEEGLEKTLDLEAENQGINFQTRDFLEGVMAFFEKRSPRYRGE